MPPQISKNRFNRIQVALHRQRINERSPILASLWKMKGGDPESEESVGIRTLERHREADLQTVAVPACQFCPPAATMTAIKRLYGLSESHITWGRANVTLTVPADADAEAKASQ